MYPNSNQWGISKSRQHAGSTSDNRSEASRPAYRNHSANINNRQGPSDLQLGTYNKTSTTRNNVNKDLMTTTPTASNFPSNNDNSYQWKDYIASRRDYDAQSENRFNQGHNSGDNYGTRSNASIVYQQNSIDRPVTDVSFSDKISQPPRLHQYNREALPAPSSQSQDNRKDLAEVELPHLENIPDWAFDVESVLDTAQSEVQFGYRQENWDIASATSDFADNLSIADDAQSSTPMAPPSSSSYQDSNTLRFCYKFLKNLIRIEEFLDEVTIVFQHSLSQLNSRTFRLLISALAVVIQNETYQAVVYRLICESWLTFVFLLKQHLKTFVMLPNDILVMLQLSAALKQRMPNIQNDLPVIEMLIVYERIKRLCTPDIIEICDDCIGVLENFIPTEGLVYDLHTAQGVLEEAMRESNILFANQVDTPYTDILNYIVVHFTLLRQELFGPIQKAIRQVFSSNLYEAIIDNCAIFEQAIPRYTTLLFSSSEPGAVFELTRPTCKYIDDHLMDKLEQGSFAFLVPDTEPPGCDTIAEGAIMGQVIYAHSNGAKSMVSIHFGKGDMVLLDWSNTYKLITCPVNAASSWSALRWLHKEYTSLNKNRFSYVLTPRILATSNTLTLNHLRAWDYENMDNAVAANQKAIPDFIAKADIEIDSIVVKKCESGSIRSSERIKFYSLLPNQFSAVKFALNRRIAVISGSQGSGKTLLAIKLVQIMNEALIFGKYEQPILVITKSETTLDTILGSLVDKIPDLIRFGGEPGDESLIDKQATNLLEFEPKDPMYSRYHWLEHQSSKNQSKLNALFKARFLALENDPVMLSAAIASPYLQPLRDGYLKGSNEQYLPGDSVIWRKWADHIYDPAVEYSSKFREHFKLDDEAQYIMFDMYLENSNRGLMPMVNKNNLKNRFNWVSNIGMEVVGITECYNWPFESSSRTVDGLRSKLMKVWRQVIPSEDQVWNASDDQKAKLVQLLTETIITYLDYEIHDVLENQYQIAKETDNMIMQRWVKLCRSSHVIGVTSDFAASRRDWISSLGPSAVVVDEASEILESILASTILNKETEHLILLGNSDDTSKPRLNNLDLSGNPWNLDVSLFERWKRSGGQIQML